MIQKNIGSTVFAARIKISFGSLYLCNGNSFIKSYENFRKFEKYYHGIDLSNGFLTNSAGMEIMKYISIN